MSWPGVVPAIYVLDVLREARRGCPRQARAWRGATPRSRGALAPESCIDGPLGDRGRRESRMPGRTGSLACNEKKHTS